MIYGSVCSGIEAASVAWHPLGWRAAFLSEIEKFPRAVLTHHYPEVPLHGDFTTIRAGEYQPIDVLVGGTPCQSFSIAGLRGGIDDDRGNLALEYLRLADRLRPRWLVWENVPGVLSSNGGRDFGSILGALAFLGYGFAYRVLDAQYYGLAQRRERVFLVGYLGDWRCAAAVLLEPASLRGDPAPRRKAGEGVAGTIRAGSGGGCGPGPDDAARGMLVSAEIAPTLDASFGRLQGASGQDANHGHGHLIAFGCNNTSGPIDVAGALNACGTASGRQDLETETFIAHTLRADGFDASEDGTGRGTPLVAVPVAHTVTTRPGGKDAGAAALVPVAFSCKDHGADAGYISPTMRAMGHATSHANAGGQLAVAMKSAVRRLTPRECERLQGFPDDYTLIPYRRKLAADGPRYKALGNSMAVPCMAWIGRRMALVDAMTRRIAA